MAVVEIPLEKTGLVDVAAVAERFDRKPRIVQRWISDGLIPAVVIRGGSRVTYLLRAADVRRFSPPTRGRPVGSRKKK